jgi:hypothetical protein
VEPYSKLFLMFRIGDEAGNETRQIKCEGIVMRMEKSAEGFDIGVRFVAMEEDDLTKLREYLYG